MSITNSSITHRADHGSPRLLATITTTRQDYGRRIKSEKMGEKLVGFVIEVRDLEAIVP